MTEYITLIGVEGIKAAAGTIREASVEIQRAVSAIDYALQRHERFLTDWLFNFETIMKTQPERKEKP